jgi:hypothetical protein
MEENSGGNTIIKNAPKSEFYFVAETYKLTTARSVVCVPSSDDVTTKPCNSSSISRKRIKSLDCEVYA